MPNYLKMTFRVIAKWKSDLDAGGSCLSGV